MIIETAFVNLPELLTGSRYPTQDYEGGIVGALSLSLLQKLNGANINSPLAAIQLERLYRKTNFWVDEAGNSRHLRVDLHLNLKGFRTASRGLSAYGWRHNNWLEAKFFRASTTGQMQNTASLLADLLRLMTLVPIERAKNDQSRTNSGRFLLHVYHGQPQDYLSINRRQNGIDSERGWLAPMLDYGRWETDDYVDLRSETNGILQQINRRLGDLQIRYTCTNYIVEPVADVAEENFYCCILTRLDSFSVRLNQATWTVREDRTFSNQQSFQQISDFVGKYINIKEIEEQPPSNAETGQDVEEIGGGVEIGGEADVNQQQDEAGNG